MADRAPLIFWTLAGIAGQACALRLIDAGKLVHYQHWRPLEAPPVYVAAVAAHALLVAAGLARLWRRRLAGAGPAGGAEWRAGGKARWIAAALFCCLASAFVSARPQVWAQELLLASARQAVALGNAILAASAVSREFRADGWLKTPRFVPLAACWVSLVSAGLCIFSYQRHPHVSDEVAYLYQARYFAAGRLDMPGPPAPGAFSLDLMTFDRGRWYSPFPPGWPAVLAAGVACGLPWLVNPLLAGLCVLLAGKLLESVYGEAVARWSVLLLAASPWFLFLAMSYMAHIFSLACALGAALLAVRRRFFFSGIAVGVLYLARPLEGMIVGAVLGVWALGFGGGARPAASLAAGFAAGGFAQFPYNRYLTGSATYFPVMAYFDKYYGVGSNAMGFGPQRGVGWPIDPFPGHGPLDALVNAALNTAAINIELFGWGTGSLLALAALVFAGRLTRADAAMLGTMAAVFTAHFFYWFSGGPDFGARYWFLMIVPCVALTARGLELLAAKAGGRAYAAALVLSAGALAAFVPWRATDKYHHYLRMRPDVRRMAEEEGFGRGLVFIRGARFPDYASAAIYNPIDLQADAPVYVWDGGAAARAEAVAAFPDRPVWVLEGPTVTGGGYRVFRRPGR